MNHSQRALVLAIALVLIPSAIGIFAGSKLDDEDLKKALYSGAVTLIFGGLLGGLLKIVLDDVAVKRKQREDAAQFVNNLLSDLKSVYDRVGRARLLIPAHQSAKTYGEEMRDLINARVQLKNAMRALHGRCDGVSTGAQEAVIDSVLKMEKYLESLNDEFRDKYKRVSDLQGAYEEKKKATHRAYATAVDAGVPPAITNEPWQLLKRDFDRLNDFVEGGPGYREKFEQALDRASEALRNELARILAERKAGENVAAPARTDS